MGAPRPGTSWTSSTRQFGPSQEPSNSFSRFDAFFAGELLKTFLLARACWKEPGAFTACRWLAPTVSAQASKASRSIFPYVCGAHSDDFSNHRAVAGDGTRILALHSAAA